MSSELINGLFAIGGALLGALITGLFSIYLAKKFKSKKELTAASTFPSLLFTMDDQIAENVVITVSDERVSTIYLVDVTFFNSGNEVISNITTPVIFKFEGEGKLLSINYKDSNFSFQNENESIKKTDDYTGLISIAFLNPGDQIAVRALVSNKPKSFEVPFRQPGITVLEKIDREGTSPDFYSKMFLASISRDKLLDLYLRLTFPLYRRLRVAVEKKNETT